MDASYLNCFETPLDFTRYETIRDQVFKQYATIAWFPLRVDALAHTSMVDSYITLLAQKRGLPLELAKIAAILHDYARYCNNIAKGHALAGAKKAKALLEELGLFSSEEIWAIVKAIQNHSKKELVHDDLDEALKDADTLAYWAMHPTEDSSLIRQKRLEKCFQELNLPIF